MIITLTVGLFAQQVDRERVIVEIATGTWCGYCPGAAMGADDLVANGCEVAVIEYHNGDAFANAASNHRNSYYSVSGYPTAHFDGVLESVGGSATSSMYGTYLPLYQQRIAIPCDYEAEIYGQNTGGQNYDVTVVIDLVDGTPPSNLTAHLVLTESEIPYAWQNQTELNFVCRAMYPDHFGTPVNFAGGTQMVINYTFTIDASWDTQHIELVAFMQDETTKEILQGSMVPIDNLIPLAATAGFTCSNTIPCETTDVDFYDESMGLITSWEWTFEGGDPGSSSAQNPVVSYNTPGTYDVQLIVDDGTVKDTLLLEDYIDVITEPVQPNTPAGPADLCGGETGYEFTTDPVANAVDYIWSIDPSSAGTITGNGTSATLDVNASYSGSIDVSVRADNQCGNGTWSQALATTAHVTPSHFWISSGSGYCEGSDGVEVTLDGSETDVDYELYLDGTSTGDIVPGTGSLISFGYQTDEGIYTIKGFTDYCQADMYGTAYIYPMAAPGQAATPYGDELACQGAEDVYSTNGAPDAETYVWTLSPEEAGTISGTDVDATVNWSAEFVGDAEISVQGNNECGDGIISDALTVSVESAPEPLISGDAFVYQNSTHIYTSEDHSGSSYDWTVTGGSIDAGQGTHEITVTWGAPGTGTVNLTETSAAECEGIAVEMVVNIDPVGIEESLMNSLSLYPNPATNALNIQLYSEQNTTITLRVLNQVGQTMISKVETMAAGNFKTSLNTSELGNGIYILKIITDNEAEIQSRFVIVK